MCKKIMTFAMALLLTAGLAAHAQQGNNALYGHPTKGGAKSISFPASSIQFWTGTGTNQAIYILAWDDDPSDNNLALAWGVRWNGTATATSLLDTIAAYDSRFSYTLSGSLMASMTYNDGTVNPGSSMNGWCYYHNGDWGQNAWPNEPVANNDVIEMSSSCTFLGTTAMAATDPNPAPSDTSATIAASDITYWVGEGNFEVVFAVNWPDTALAWGYRFSGRSTNLQTVMDAIANADPRFSYVTGNYGIEDILFIENGDTLHKASGSWWEHTLNGQMSNGVAQQLNHGDFSRWADPTAGVVVDSTYDTAWGGYWNYTRVYPQAITPVSAPATQDATISANDIRFWVGEGDSRAIFVVNWPDTTLAWGYRFTGNATVQNAMDAIADTDSRFSYELGQWGIDDILFVENGDTMHKASASWWEHTLNGTMSMGMYQPLADGDFSRWYDPTTGVVVDSTYDTAYGGYWTYIYAFPQRIYPAHNPNAPVTGPFCGAVGTEGCTAIAFDDPTIKGWATGCTLVRGSQDLSNPNAPAVTYGTEADAVGPASASTMDVVSLGDAGSATLTFAQPIRNGEGYDFAVFENSFNDFFLELGFVEVSSDGVTFVRFPATSLTQTDRQIGGTGSVDPTFINNLAGKYRVGYGTPFDLDELRDSTGIDINNITHVRIIDVVGSIDPLLGNRDAFGHMINDPFPTNSHSAGFDLDGVAVLNSANSIAEADAAHMEVYPNPVDSRLQIVLSAPAAHSEAALYDMTGRKVSCQPVEAGTTRLTIATGTLPCGIYMLRLGEQTRKIIIRH